MSTYIRFYTQRNPSGLKEKISVLISIFPHKNWLLGNRLTSVLRTQWFSHCTAVFQLRIHINNPCAPFQQPGLQHVECPQMILSPDVSTSAWQNQHPRTAELQQVELSVLTANKQTAPGDTSATAWHHLQGIRSTSNSAKVHFKS